MACNCPGSLTDCLKVFVGPCDIGVPTGIEVAEGGDYLIRLTLNGVATQMTLSVTEDTEIVLPNTINNSAVYEMEIYGPDGELLNDTCYKLRTIVTLGNESSEMPPNPVANPKKFITVAQDGSAITDAFFGSNTISEIDTNNQAYLRNVDFTQSGGTITGITISFYIGQIILAKV